MSNLLDNWKCPSCDDNGIEEIMTGAVVSSEVIHVPDDCTDFEYGEQTSEVGVIDRYQCMTCRRTIAHTPEELVEALGGMIQEDETTEDIMQEEDENGS